MMPTPTATVSASAIQRGQVRRRMEPSMRAVPPGVNNWNRLRAPGFGLRDGLACYARPHGGHNHRRRTPSGLRARESRRPRARLRPESSIARRAPGRHARPAGLGPPFPAHVSRAPRCRRRPHRDSRRPRRRRPAASSRSARWSRADCTRWTTPPWTRRDASTSPTAVRAASRCPSQSSASAPTARAKPSSQASSTPRPWCSAPTTGCTCRAASRGSSTRWTRPASSSRP